MSEVKRKIKVPTRAELKQLFVLERRKERKERRSTPLPSGPTGYQCSKCWAWFVSPEARKAHKANHGYMIKVKVKP